MSALFGADPVGHAIPQDTKAEAERIFTNLVAILAAAGTDLTNVVRVGIVMRDLQRDRPALNKVWAERFGDHRPARSAVESPAFPAGGRCPVHDRGHRLPWLIGYHRTRSPASSR